MLLRWTFVIEIRHGRPHTIYPPAVGLGDYKLQIVSEPAQASRVH